MHVTGPLCISWLWYVISMTLESVGRLCHYIRIHNILLQHRTCILSEGAIEVACSNSLEKFTCQWSIPSSSASNGDLLGPNSLYLVEMTHEWKKVS